jgi:hypothetical protein
MGIRTTGNSRIDTATAEIAGHVRDGRVGSHVKYRDQDHYDEAMRLRDEIIAGTQVRDAASAEIEPDVFSGDGYTPITGPGDGLLVHNGYGQCGAVITAATRHQHDDWHRELAERVYGDG